MDPYSAIVVIGLVVLVVFGGYGLYGKRRIEQLDREIEADEAAARARLHAAE